jgi:phosphinothricin acetyltransferase
MFLQYLVQMLIRVARPDDLAEIVEIYNATVPDRRATADLEPVSETERRAWFERHTPGRRPLWIAGENPIQGWLSLEDFYGRPAYEGTAEVSVYVRADRRHGGLGRALLAHALEQAPALGLSALLAFVFAHNESSIGLFRSAGFERWGLLPAVARLDRLDADLVILGRRVPPPA